MHDQSNWITDLLGDGWFRWVLTVIGGAVLAVCGYLARRPIEAAGVRKQLDDSMTEHLGELRTDIKRLRDERAEDRERHDQIMADEKARCDDQLAELRDRIDELMAGPAAAYTSRDVERGLRRGVARPPKAKRPKERRP